MEIKVIKAKDGVLLSGRLPSQIENADSLEIFPLRDGMFILVPKEILEKASGREEAEMPVGLDRVEIEVIRKLSSVRFERRIPSEMEKLLSVPERLVLGKLVARKLVTVFRSSKYGKEGVYNITDGVYPLVRREGEAAQTKPPQPVQTSQQAKPGMPPHLASEGWMVLENDEEARRLSETSAHLVKSGEIMGTRAFDRKYYFISKSFLIAWEKKLDALLAKGDRNADELAEELGIAPDGCRAMVYNLCERGELLEKQKGKFARA
ncbi:MAG: hypothetical protein NT051_00660 [Candidatus Micrarchaeota archaeon]|nr:hypothetical protein [Candidatus Micrarchaeota archaeon]